MSADTIAMDQRGHQAYQTNAVETASPEQLTLMCYDGALKFMRRAIKAFDNGDRERISEATGRAQAIINELNITLDMEAGGEISKNLRDIYLFVNRHLSQAIIDQNPQNVRDAIELLMPLREAWAKAMNIDQQAA